MRAPQVVDVPSLMPGTCFTCGSVAGPQIDMMVDLPEWGRVYICVETCLAPSALLVGLGPVAPLQEVIAERDDWIGQLEAEVESQRETIEAYKLILAPAPKVAA